MAEINYTLLTDGSSDRVLMRVIDWLLTDLAPFIPIQGNYADFSHLKNPPTSRDLNLRIEKAIALFPCDLLFVHRDAENMDLQERLIEIQTFWTKSVGTHNLKMVPIIPVRMTETWLLIDEQAIKIAAGNRNFDGAIVLPPLQKLENELKPKELLFELIRTASNKKGRSLDKLNVHQARHIVAEHVSNYSNLRTLRSFQFFEQQVRNVLIEIGLMP